MRSAIAICLLVSGWANALTLSPMRIDSIVYGSSHITNLSITNTNVNVAFYDVWVSKNVETLEPEGGLYQGETVIGSDVTISFSVPIFNIKPDDLEVYYVCVQERPDKSEMSVVGRVCAKLRLYWPASELRTLQ